MKTLLTMLCLSLCLLQSVQAEDVNNGLTLTGLAQQNESAFNIRASYRIGLLEPFIGSELRLDSDPEVFNAGCLIHSGDIIDANDGIPWLSPMLTSVLNDKLVMTAYTGFHTTVNFNNKGSYYGSIIGGEIKDKADSPLSLIGEIHFDDIGEESNLDEAGITETPIYAGLKYTFRSKKSATVLAYAGKGMVGLTASFKF